MTLLPFIGVFLTTLVIVDSKDTRIAFGSCNRQNYGGIWRQIDEDSPDYLMLLGDNVYNDMRNKLGKWQPAPVEAIRDSYKQLSEDKDWVLLSSKLGRDRIFATWDDHDYGLDNGDRTFINRRESLELFLDFFHTDAVDREHRLNRGGVYKSHIISIPRGNNEDDFVVKVIMLDTRYYRDPKGSSPDADMLGEEQWSWLEREMSESSDLTTPDLIILGSSVQVLSTQKIFEENWADYPKARRRLLNLVANVESPNIIILSGDIHMMEVSQAWCSGTNPLYNKRHLVELTSSGLTHTFTRYMSVNDSPGESSTIPTILSKGRLLQILYDTYEASYPARYRQHKFKDFYQGIHFSTLDIVLPDSSSTETSGVRFRVVNYLGEMVYTSFYPFLSPNNEFKIYERNCTSSDGNFVCNENETMGYECTPYWGHEQPVDYFLHVFCLTCVLYIFLGLPALAVLWLIFASIYYIWFITEDKRRAKLMALHEKKD